MTGSISRSTTSTLEVSVWRGGESGYYETYTVPARDNQTILDVVTYIQRHVDPTLSYRFACRVGMCGSCAMTVNGKPRWTCRSHARVVAEDGKLEIAPLRNFKVIKDLAVDMEAFFEKWRRAEGSFQGVTDRHEEFSVVSPNSKERKQADAGIECIGCGVCYAACDVVAWNKDYLGPAALNRAWTLMNDERDNKNTVRLAAVAGDAGCHACHSHQSCVEQCPKFLNPTASIAGLKRAAAAAALKGEL
jgi:fumarate reductase iron-sulfur subunit